MALVRIILAATLAAIVSLPASAQGDGQCIVAGRLADDGRWAPRFEAVQLLGSDGRVIARSTRDALGGVKQAKLAKPALLSRCDGDKEMARADTEAAGKKGPVPMVSAGVVQVESVSYPKLRTGGTLVELKVRAPAERVVMLTR